MNPFAGYGQMAAPQGPSAAQGPPMMPGPPQGMPLQAQRPMMPPGQARRATPSGWGPSDSGNAATQYPTPPQFGMPGSLAAMQMGGYRPTGTGFGG